MAQQSTSSCRKCHHKHDMASLIMDGWMEWTDGWMEWGGCAWFTCRHVRSISMQGWIWSSHCGRDNLHKGCRKAITAWHDISIASRSYHMSHHGSCGRDNLHKGCREAITTRHGISHHIISHHITTTPHPLSPTMWVCVCDCRYTSHHSSSHHITFTSCVFHGWRDKST